jgi:hypothetical protein
LTINASASKHKHVAAQRLIPTANEIEMRNGVLLKKSKRSVVPVISKKLSVTSLILDVSEIDIGIDFDSTTKKCIHRTKANSTLMTLLHGVDFIVLIWASVCAASFLITVIWSLVTSAPETRNSEVSRTNASLVVLTVCNAAWLDLCDNFLISSYAQFYQSNSDVNKNDVSFTVVALDSATERHLTRNWPNVTLVSNVLSASDTNDEAKWKSQRYFEVVSVKPRHVRRLLSAGSHVLLCDADVVWLQNVAEYAKIHLFNASALISFQDDIYGPNTGLFFARANSASLAFIDGWIRFSEINRNENNDQHMLHRWLETEEGAAARDAVGLALLDRAQFPVGVEYFKKRTQAVATVEAWAVHANWVIGLRAKRWALRQHLLWFAPWTLETTCMVTLRNDELLDGCNTRECHSAAVFRLVAAALRQPAPCGVAMPLLPCTASFVQTYGRTRCSLHNAFDVNALLSSSPVPLEPNSVLFDPRLRDAVQTIDVTNADWRRCWNDNDVINANFTVASLRVRLFPTGGDVPLCQQRSNTL